MFALQRVLKSGNLEYEHESSKEEQHKTPEAEKYNPSEGKANRSHRAIIRTNGNIQLNVICIRAEIYIKKCTYDYQEFRWALTDTISNNTVRLTVILVKMQSRRC